MGRFHARLTAKGDGGLAGRKVELGDCFGVGAEENTMGVQVPIPHLKIGHWERSCQSTCIIVRIGTMPKVLFTILLEPSKREQFEDGAW